MRHLIFGEKELHRAERRGIIEEKDAEVGKMPLLQYRCKSCGKEFEELVKSHGDAVLCPACGGEAERRWAGCMYSSTGKPPKTCSGKCSECSGCH